jgi:hypothetical protein
MKTLLVLQLVKKEAATQDEMALIVSVGAASMTG